MVNKRDRKGRFAVNNHTTCTPEVVARICEHIRNGSSFLNAYEAEGIPKQTIDNWRVHAEKDEVKGIETVFTDAMDMLNQVKAGAKCLAEEAVYKGGSNWQSKARWLEAVDKQNWQKTQVLVGDKDNPVIIKEVVMVRPEEKG